LEARLNLKLLLGQVEQSTGRIAELVKEINEKHHDIEDLEALAVAAA